MKQITLSFYDIAVSLSELIDLVNPSLNGHHNRVAYIANRICLELDLNENEKNDTITAALLHDIGALSLEERFEALKFAIPYTDRHPELGYRLLKTFSSFGEISKLVRYHHTAWNNGKSSVKYGRQIPLGSHIIHLADRVDVLINKNISIITQIPAITSVIVKNSGYMFCPKLVDSFIKLAEKESFWLDIMHASSPSCSKLDLGSFTLDTNGLLEISYLFKRVIDFRSKFTATHSTGVAAVASELSRRMGFSEDECTLMEIAGYVHDLGKLVIPNEILEKPGPLTKEEYDIIKSHTYHSYRVLRKIKGFERINEWGSFHHEHLSGKGYPFHLKEGELSLGARVMCVSDVFTASAEDRPYRKGLPPESILNILKLMVENKQLDSRVVECLTKNFVRINEIRQAAQENAAMDYEAFFAQN